jgi:hypothetical protein
MHRHRSRALFLVLLAAAALVAGCRSDGPTSPGGAAALTDVQPLGPAHRHQHVVAALQHRAQQFRKAQEKGTTYRLADPPAGVPLPIPGGLFPGLHLWLPGPPELGVMGLDVEPNSITDFNGFVAMGYMIGSATGSDGNAYDQFHDMRVMRGAFVDSEGRRQSGTFVLI